MSPKKLFRRFCGPTSSGCVGTLKSRLRQTFFAHFRRPWTIPSWPLRHKFDLDPTMSSKKLSRRLCGPRSSGCVASGKNSLKQACFAHFGEPGTIPNRLIKHKFGLELMMCPKKFSRSFFGQRPSGCIATVKSCFKQACFAHFNGPGTISSQPIRHKLGLELMMSPKKLFQKVLWP